MTKKFKKGSKRVSCRKRYKIERKVREHNRKARKESKKNGNKRPKKDPGVPNSFPMKDEILKEAEARKRRLEEEREKQKERRKKDRLKTVNKKRNLVHLVKDAERRGAEFERKSSFVSEKTGQFTAGKSVESSLKAYFKEFSKVVENADVILQVLDARDPLGSRCPQVEQAVLGAGSSKKLVLILNKIDLVPKENVEAWLKYLRKEFPTVAFKASTQTQSDHLSHSKVPLALASDDLRKSSCCLGAENLMKLIGNYCRKKDLRTAITVGVVGFPNTGKSSLINSLKRSKACNVGATPGVTKSMQAVQLDKHVKLLDSPGIVMATGDTDAATILKNCVKVETVEDPVIPVEAILKRCTKQQIMLQYNVANFSDVNEFLSLLAIKQGRLRKGGVPDVDRAAKVVLQDWNSGKITYYTHPPEQHTLASHLSAKIVTQMSSEFDIEALMKDEEATIEGLKGKSNSAIVIESEGLTEGLVTSSQDAVMSVDEENDENDEENDEEEENEEETEVMEEDEEASGELSNVTVAMKGKKKKKIDKNMSNRRLRSQGEASPSSLPGNMQLNKLRKDQLKKMKRKKTKTDVKLSDALNSAMSGLGASNGQAAYDFKEHFK